MTDIKNRILDLTALGKTEYSFIGYFTWPEEKELLRLGYVMSSEPFGDINYDRDITISWKL